MGNPPVGWINKEYDSFGSEEQNGDVIVLVVYLFVTGGFLATHFCHYVIFMELSFRSWGGKGVYIPFIIEFYLFMAICTYYLLRKQNPERMLAYQ